jgi:predicted porin
MKTMKTMKTTVLIAACMALASSYAAAQSGSVQIYGRLNVALENVRNSSDAKGQRTSTTRESNYRSVLGFRGSEALGDGLKAIYQIEGTLSVDTGAGAIAARDTRIGLEGKFGTIFGGNWTTPYNAATSGLDPFYPTTAGYMSIMGNGSASTSDNLIDTSSFDRRQQNSVHYWSPNWNGLSVRVAHGLNEEKPASGAKPSLTSMAAIYEQGPLHASVSHERHHEYQGPGRNDHGTKIGAAYRFGATRIAAIAERLTYETASGKLERKSYYLSATHQIGAHGIRFGVATAGDGEGSSTQKIGFMKKGPDTGATHYTLGYDYNFSKRTSAFAYYTLLDNEKNAVHDFAINSLGAGAGATLKGSALGIRHAF